ncbi:probable salivary secreted peptide [Plodia interpunctella]|uniref:probable salivary secreted peptide n=1 Tax=Plodia interpunctella TaxID=58824 RepID=UPI002368566E|nr:probable salivary secreted peptide [Plodia interpunctella]
MKTLIWVTLFSFVVYVSSENRFFGVKTPDSKLIYRKRVFLEAFPFKKRVDYVEFTNSAVPITAVYCYDYQNSEASVNCTSGGVGYNYVTLRLKSQRSYRLDYAIEIYA